MKAYEECLTATSTRNAPWYVVPADDKANARLIVSRIALDTLEGLKMTYPKTSAERRRELLRPQTAHEEVLSISAPAGRRCSRALSKSTYDHPRAGGTSGPPILKG